MIEKPKASKCCGEFESKNPGAGAHYPDPCKHCGWSQADHRTAPAMTPAVQALIAKTIREMNEALQGGALFNPEMFGSMLKGNDNPILRWRDQLDQALADLQGES